MIDVVPAIPHFKFVNVVWGEIYIENYLKFSLPTTLSKGNLSELAESEGASYHLYTSRLGEDAIRASPAFQDLADLMPVEVLLIDEICDIDPNTASKYVVMNTCHCHHIQSHPGGKNAYVFLSPDMLCAEESLSPMLQRIAGGNRVVLCSGLRLTAESILPKLELARTGNGLSIPTRQMVSLALESLHPEILSFLFDGETSASHPSMLIWTIEGSGMLLRAFHLHPLVVWPRNHHEKPQVTIDDNYLQRACPDLQEYSIVQDSDDGVIFSFSSQDGQPDPARRETLDFAEIGKWVSSTCGVHHRHYATVPIRIHHADLNDSWQEAEWNSLAVIVRALNEASTEDERVLLQHKTELENARTVILGFEEKLKACRKRIENLKAKLSRSKRNSAKGVFARLINRMRVLRKRQ